MKIKKILNVSTLTNKTAICIELAIAAVIAMALILSLSSLNPLYAALIVILLYSLAVFLLLYFYKDLQTNDPSAILTPALGNVMVGAVRKLHSPVFIIDEAKERIIWHNKATSSLIESRSLQNKVTLRDLFDIADEAYTDLSAMDGNVIRSGERTFRASITPIKTSSRQFSLFELTEITDIENLYAEIAAKNIIVSYIIVDNLNDMLQNQQQMYREASSKIQDILTGWAKENDGVIKEYDRNHYIFFFEESKLDG